MIDDTSYYKNRAFLITLVPSCGRCVVLQLTKTKSQKPSHFKNLFTNIISEEQQQFSRSLYMQVQKITILNFSSPLSFFFLFIFSFSLFELQDINTAKGESTGSLTALTQHQQTPPSHSCSNNMYTIELHCTNKKRYIVTSPAASATRLVAVRISHSTQVQTSTKRRVQNVLEYYLHLCTTSRFTHYKRKIYTAETFKLKHTTGVRKIINRLFLTIYIEFNMCQRSSVPFQEGSVGFVENKRFKTRLEIVAIYKWNNQ